MSCLPVSDSAQLKLNSNSNDEFVLKNGEIKQIKLTALAETKHKYIIIY